MKILFLGIGKTKHKYLIEGIERYKKLLNPYVSIDELYLKEEDEKSNPADTESDKLIKNIPAGYFTVLMDIKGNSPTSEEFAEMIRSKRDSSILGIVFIIGGSEGVSDKLRNVCSHRLSFSALTFTHQMIRFFLAEQIYRAYSIINNKKYHK